MLVNPLCMLKLIDFPLFIGIFSILRVCSRVFTIHFLLCSSYKAKLRVTGTVPCLAFLKTSITETFGTTYVWF